MRIKLILLFLLLSFFILGCDTENIDGTSQLVSDSSLNIEFVNISYSSNEIGVKVIFGDESSEEISLYKNIYKRLFLPKDFKIQIGNFEKLVNASYTFFKLPICELLMLIDFSKITSLGEFNNFLLKIGKFFDFNYDFSIEKLEELNKLFCEYFSLNFENIVPDTLSLDNGLQLDGINLKKKAFFNASLLNKKALYFDESSVEIFYNYSILTSNSEISSIETNFNDLYKLKIYVSNLEQIRVSLLREKEQLDSFDINIEKVFESNSNRYKFRFLDGKYTLINGSYENLLLTVYGDEKIVDTFEYYKDNLKSLNLYFDILTNRCTLTDNQNHTLASFKFDINKKNNSIDILMNFLYNALNLKKIINNEENFINANFDLPGYNSVLNKIYE